MFCEILRKHAKNIIGFEKKKMLPLTKEELKSQDHKVCYIHGKRILKNLSKSINYQKKLEIILTIEVNIEVQNIIFLI